MSVPKRSVITALVATAAITAGALATAAPASAASYKCSTSKKSIDDPSYSGPWADNWDVTVRLCAKRSGRHVYTYAKVSWDGPVGGAVDDRGIFDGAYFQLQVKRSRAGADPIVRSGNYYRIESHLENSSANANYNGSYTTPVLTYRIGTAKGLAPTAR
ncbi:hypothetical protein [Streptomyces sp. NPDC020681]|uniref:hypothetical protein n=1 Tax=Streptomyces sp. NPDC020681 TaxID=3365083 RepID=UPI00378F7B2E